MAEPYEVFLSPPHLTGREMHYIQQVIDSNYLAPAGPMLAAFEQEFCRCTGIPHAAAVASGTAALHLALRVLGIGLGDHVWAASLTFMGGVSPITFQQAIPTFIDCEPEYWTLDPKLLEQALGEAKNNGKLPRAVIITDLYGQCCNYAAIRALCKRYEVYLIADVAEALGSKYEGRHAGADADIAIFSFNGNKIITTSGGGMIASHNRDWIAHAAKLASQAREPVAHYEHAEIGFNYRMSNILAAVGRAQLETIEDRVKARRAIRQRYIDGLKGLPVSFLPERPGTRMNAWLSVMLLDEKCRKTPEDIRLALLEKRIEARAAWKPMHLQPVFKNVRCVGGKVAEDIFTRGLCLPSGSSLDEKTQQRIIGIIHADIG